MMKTFRILSIAALLIFEMEAVCANEQPNLKNQDDDKAQSISFFVENDIYFSDRYYTNGLKLLYTESGDDFIASKLQFMLLRFCGIDGRQASQTVCLGQNMYTPTSIHASNPPADDRPYAGWLYIGAGANLASENRLDSLAVNIGVVGPISLAEDTQKFYHSLIGADYPYGWGYQIKNEPAIDIAYLHSERIFRENLTSSFQTDALLNIGADLGNFLTQAQIGAFWRLGFNIPYNFTPTRIEGASAADAEWVSKNGRPQWHCFIYGGGCARFVGYDITLDGNTFADSRSVTPKWLVGEAMAGISSRYKDFQLDLNWTLRTAEFNGQKHPVHMFWTLRAKIFF